jgi:Fe-S cluster assembly protein SufD
MIQQVKKKTEWYLKNFELFERSLNGESASEIHTMRRAAIATFADLGFPTAKNEEWRFTNVAPIANAQFKPVLNYVNDAVTAKDIDQFTLGERDCKRLVFINGHFAPELSLISSLPESVKVGNVANALKTSSEVLTQHLARYVKATDNAFTALSTAFIRDGAYIVVPEGCVMEEPIHLLFIATAHGASTVSHPRNLIVAGKDSQVSVVESYVSLAKIPYLTNAVTEFVVGENSVIEHDKLQDESVMAFHVGTMHVEQSTRSTFTSNSISLGGSIVRNNITAVLNGEGVESTLNGLSLATGQQHVDNHTAIDHAKPNCVSHELYKSILDGKSKGVFNGKIYVRKDSQKTDAKQTNKTLLLSDDATIDTKPQLEIFADDVKCTHGATVGQLDEEQVFYLRARGIDEVAARDMLTFAFASDVIGRVHVESLRDRLDQMVHARLRAGRLISSQL